MFYAGLVRSKNTASIFAQTIAVVCLVMIFWLVIGYSLAFTNGGPLNGFVGGTSKAFLDGVQPTRFHRLFPTAYTYLNISTFVFR